jgi:hypothetical protein
LHAVGGFVLGVAEEHVAVVDDALDFEDLDLAQAAFAAAAVEASRASSTVACRQRR